MSNQISENALGSYFDYYESETNNIFNSYQTIVSTSASVVTLSFKIPYAATGTQWECTISGENITTPNLTTSGFATRLSGGCYVDAASPFTVFSSTYVNPAAAYNIGTSLPWPTIPTVAAGAVGTQSLVVSFTGIASTITNVTAQMRFSPSAI